MSELQQLRDRVEALEIVLGLRMPENHAIAARRLMTAVGVHPAPARLIGILLKRDLISTEGAAIALGDHEPRSEELVHGYIGKVRKALKPYGIKVENVWNTGWRITEPNKRKLRALLDSMVQAA